MPDEDGSGEPIIDIPDAANPVGIRKAQEKARRVKDARGDFWRAVLETPTGRAEMWRLLAFELHIFEAPFAAGPTGFPQDSATWFRFGQQSAGLGIYHDLMALDRVGILRMLDEHDPRFRKTTRQRVKD